MFVFVVVWMCVWNEEQGRYGNWINSLNDPNRSQNNHNSNRTNWFHVSIFRLSFAKHTVAKHFELCSARETHKIFHMNHFRFNWIACKFVYLLHVQRSRTARCRWFFSPLLLAVCCPSLVVSRIYGMNWKELKRNRFA